MASLGPAPKPSVERKSNFYVKVTEEDLDHSKYPTFTSSIHPSVTSPAQCQAQLRLRTNFSDETDCDVFEVTRENGGTWMTLDDRMLSQYLSDTMTAAQAPYLRVLFLYLADSKNSSFSSRLSTNQDTASRMLDTFSVNPHFVQFMLGKPDYLAPFSTHDRNEDGHTIHEYIGQFPRWHIRNPKRENPCSIYLKYDEYAQSTTYIVVSGKDDPVINKARKTLGDCFTLATTFKRFLQARVDDPFLLSSIICRESLLDAEGVIRKLRMGLYDQLDIVDSYADSPFDRNSLKQVTNALHRISQDCESLLASAEMLAMMIRAMARAHQHIKNMNRGSQAKLYSDHDVEVLTPRAVRQVNQRTEDSLAYLSEAIESQKRWIKSYISRKDVAMNLVYQLVMQQDSETSTSIAKATRDDSNVMKVIAIVTIVFLPSAVVTSFFGMTFFNTTNDGQYVINRGWWIFWAVSIPLTVIVLFTSYAWWRWPEIRALMAVVRLKSGHADGHSAQGDMQDIECGIVSESGSAAQACKSQTGRVVIEYASSKNALASVTTQDCGSETKAVVSTTITEIVKA